MAQGSWSVSQFQKLAVLSALAVLSMAVTLGAAEGLRIVPLVRDDRVLVTFELADEVRAAVRSGLKTTFTYTVDLRLEVPAWVDRTIATAVLTNSVEYDNLTRQHSITRVLDGTVESTQVTDSEALVRQMMTSFQRLPLFRTSVLEANREYYVRITATARPTNGAFLWPWGSGTSGQAKFTFIR
jgi:Domain of unknown function (DUF4390)